MFVEEYTLVAVSDYVLSHTPGNTVSNLSSSRALRDVTLSHPGCAYNAAAVGEVNVVTKMKETGAVIGGEGNGGVIYPEIHYGRDALVGVALFLTLLAKSGKKVTELKAGYPQYAIAKNKIQLTPEIDVDKILQAVKDKYMSDPAYAARQYLHHGYRRSEDRFSRQLGPPAQVEHRADNPYLQRGAHHGRGRKPCRDMKKGHSRNGVS